MAKKLTLNETWRLCLKMWRWITGQEKTGRYYLCIGDLKDEWLRNNWSGEDLICECFFCDYATVHLRKGHTRMCSACPARRVDSEFDCMGTAYDYSCHPIAFYNKLVSLNRKRKAKKGK